MMVARANGVQSAFDTPIDAPVGQFARIFVGALK